MPPVQYIRVTNPLFLELGESGRPASGYLVWTLVAGTVSSLVDTYTDRELTSKNTNPIVLDARGEAHIFTGDQALKLVFTLPGGDLSSPIWTEDYVTEQQNFIADRGEAVGTSNNLYSVDTVPAYTTIPDGFSLVVIPDISNLDSMIARTFTGTGINDAFFYGPYVGTTPSTFSVEIDGTGTPNTFKWKKDAGAWTTGVPITGLLQSLQEGVGVKFSSTTGHTSGDLWTQTVRAPARLNFCGLGAKLIYKIQEGALVGLEGGDMIADIPAHLDYSAGDDSWILLNPSLPVFSEQVPARQRKEITATYDVLPDGDWGVELSCKGTFDVNLPSCTDAVGKFYYINNTGTGTITLKRDAAPDVILIPGDSTGVTELELKRDGWTAVQLVSNGVDWHVLTATNILHGMATLVNGVPWVCPPGVTEIWVTACAGGGGGGGTYETLFSGDSAGVGGLRGAINRKVKYTVVPGTSYAVQVGAGGVAGSHSPTTPGSGGQGGPTSLGALFSLTGGTGGAGAPNGITGHPRANDGEDCPGFGAGGRCGWGEAAAMEYDGQVGQGYGAGGGGGYNTDGGDGAHGGAGAPGFLFIEW